MTEELQLPFEVKMNKSSKKKDWKSHGMIFDNYEFEYWYNEIIYAKNCSIEKCKKTFLTSQDRHLDHNHDTGEIRDIICNKCNNLREDNKIRSDNTSGFRGISKLKNKKCKQGFIWRFTIWINGKQKTIKKSVDKEFLIEFAKKWLKENDYYT